MIISNPIPGQEDRNLNFLVNTGAAIITNDTFGVQDALNMLFTSPWRIRIMEESVSHIGKPNATADLYNFAVSKTAAKATAI